MRRERAIYCVCMECYALADSHASIQSLYTSTASDRSAKYTREIPHIELVREQRLTVNGCLKIFQAHPTRDHSSVPLPIAAEGEVVTLYNHMGRQLTV